MNFSNPQIGELTRLLGLGYGRVRACAAMKVDYKTFQRAIREQDGFAAAVEAAEASCQEACDHVVFRIATTSYNELALRAAIAFLGRRDKIELARQAREDRKEASLAAEIRAERRSAPKRKAEEA